MKTSTYRFLRFNFISKLLFKNKKIDYFIRKTFMQNFFDNHYSISSKNFIKINNELNPILNKYNGFLGHGLALKLIRDNEIPKSQDLDYDIYNLKNVDAFIAELEEMGFELFQRSRNNNIDKFLTFYKNGSYIDFFLCDVFNNKFDIYTICCETIFPRFKKENGYYTSNKFISYRRRMTYTDITTKNLMGNIFFLPKNYDIYFREMYGDDWKTPKEYFNWAINPKNNKPKKITKKNHVLISKKNYELNYK